MSATLVVRHHVAGYAEWRQAYDKTEPLRARYGCTAARVLRLPDDANDLLVTHDFPTIDKAGHFASDPALSAAMQRAGVDAPRGSRSSPAPEPAMPRSRRRGRRSQPADRAPLGVVKADADSASMTALPDFPEHRGWIRRTPNPDDRRSVLVQITAEGQATAGQMLPGIRELERRTMDVLTGEESPAPGPAQPNPQAIRRGSRTTRRQQARWQVRLMAG